MLLAKLGPKRDDQALQLRYLIDIASQYQEVVNLALASRDGGHEIFNDPAGGQKLKIATMIVTRNEAFSQDVEKYGHTYSFLAEDDAKTPKPDDAAKTKPSPKFSTRKNNCPIGIGFLKANQYLDQPLSNITSWLRDIYDGSRGFELGTVNSTLLATTWKVQSQKWESISLGYISDIISIAHQFVADLLRLVCPDSRVRAGLSDLLVDRLQDCYKKVVAQVEFILHVERFCNPTTLNHYFNDNLEKW